MARNLITHFDPDPALRDSLLTSLEPAVGDPHQEWSGNLISRRAIVYGSGRWARRGEPVVHRVDPDELALCRRLGHDAAKAAPELMLGSGGPWPAFREYSCAANDEREPSRQIDESLLRAGFGSALWSECVVRVEPLEERGAWWADVLARVGTGAGQSRALFPWRQLVGWFATQPDFEDRAFATISAGSPSPASHSLCLALGLTRQGSLAGLLGALPNRD